MALKKKSDLDALKDISPEDRADLVALFDTVESTNTQIAELRKKSSDADEVVNKNKQLEKLLQSKEKLSAELQEKLSALTTHAPKPASFEDMLPFREIRQHLEEMLSGDAGAETTGES